MTKEMISSRRLLFLLVILFGAPTWAEVPGVWFLNAKGTGPDFVYFSVGGREGLPPRSPQEVYLGWSWIEDDRDIAVYPEARSFRFLPFNRSGKEARTWEEEQAGSRLDLRVSLGPGNEIGIESDESGRDWTLFLDAVEAAFRQSLLDPESGSLDGDLEVGSWGTCLIRSMPLRTEDGENALLRLPGSARPSKSGGYFYVESDSTAQEIKDVVTQRYRRRLEGDCSATDGSRLQLFPVPLAERTSEGSDHLIDFSGLPIHEVSEPLPPPPPESTLAPTRPQTTSAEPTEKDLAPRRTFLSPRIALAIAGSALLLALVTLGVVLVRFRNTGQSLDEARLSTAVRKEVERAAAQRPEASKDFSASQDHHRAQLEDQIDTLVQRVRELAESHGATEQRLEDIAHTLNEALAANSRNESSLEELQYTVEEMGRRQVGFQQEFTAQWEREHDGRIKPLEGRMLVLSDKLEALDRKVPRSPGKSVAAHPRWIDAFFSVDSEESRNLRHSLNAGVELGRWIKTLLDVMARHHLAEVVRRLPRESQSEWQHAHNALKLFHTTDLPAWQELLTITSGKPSERTLAYIRERGLFDDASLIESWRRFLAPRETAGLLDEVVTSLQYLTEAFPIEHLEGEAKQGFYDDLVAALTEEKLTQKLHHELLAPLAEGLGWKYRVVGYYQSRIDQEGFGFLKGHHEEIDLSKRLGLDMTKEGGFVVRLARIFLFKADRDEYHSGLAFVQLSS